MSDISIQNEWINIYIINEHIFEKRGFILKIYELVFKIKELTFKINGLIFKISELVV